MAVQKKGNSWALYVTVVVYLTENLPHRLTRSTYYVYQTFKIRVPTVQRIFNLSVTNVV